MDKIIQEKTAVLVREAVDRERVAEAKRKEDKEKAFNLRGKNV